MNPVARVLQCRVEGDRASVPCGFISCARFGIGSDFCQPALRKPHRDSRVDGRAILESLRGPIYQRWNMHAHQGTTTADAFCAQSYGSSSCAPCIHCSLVHAPVIVRKTAEQQRGTSLKSARPHKGRCSRPRSQPMLSAIKALAYGCVSILLRSH